MRSTTAGQPTRPVMTQRRRRPAPTVWGVAAVVAVSLALTACADDDDSAGTVAFGEPADGATVAGPVAMTMTAEGWA